MNTELKPHPCLTLAAQRLGELNPDQFELYFEHRVATRIDAKKQTIDSLCRSEDVGLSIRTLKDGRLGFSYTTSLDPKAILGAVETAFEVSKHMPEDPHLALQSLSNAVYPHLDRVDHRGLDLPLTEKMNLARKLEAACLSADSRITGVRKASLHETQVQRQLMDSHGEWIGDARTVFSGSLTCKAEAQGESQVGSDFDFSDELDALNMETIGRRAAQWATELLGASRPSSFLGPAVLRNSVVADLIEFLSSSFSAEEVDKGRSLLAKKQGQRILSDSLTLIQDGLYPGGLGSSPFDAEGTPSKKTVLVDGGFLKHFLTNVYYAKKNGLEPTASATRRIQSPPAIGISNLYLAAGRKAPEDLLDGISRGVLITDLMGIHTANPVTGDFSLGASGILIENGKSTRSLRGFAVAGNLLELLRRVTDVGNDLRFFGQVGAPSLRVSEVSISGT